MCEGALVCVTLTPSFLKTGRLKRRQYAVLCCCIQKNPAMLLCDERLSVKHN